MKRALLFFGVLAIVIVVIFLITDAAVGTKTSPASLSPYTNALRTIELDGQTLHVFVAADEADRQLGLGGRSGLPTGDAMLFVFPSDTVSHFWMKDMSFSIDIVWLASDGTVIYIAPDITPSTYPQAFGPDEPARYVLELPAGWAKEYSMKVGDKAVL